MLTSAAAYIVEVSPTQADRTNVTGTATLAGTVQAVFGPGSYIARTYTILSAAGGRSGTFGSLTTSGLPAGFAAALELYRHRRDLESHRGAGTATHHAGTAAAAERRPERQPAQRRQFAQQLLQQRRHAAADFVTIFGLTGANLGNALSPLSGEAATGAQQAGFQLGSQFLGLMLDPFVDGRSGVAGTSGPALGFAPERTGAARGHRPRLFQGDQGAGDKAGARPYEQRWSAWGGAFGGNNKTSGDPAVVGSTISPRAPPASPPASTIASRPTVSSVSRSPAAAPTGASRNGLGGGKSDAFQAGVYGATRSGPAYLAAAFAFTNHWMSTDRFAVRRSSHRRASTRRASAAGSRAAIASATPVGGITPYAAMQAQSFRTPGYSETDATGGGFALAYNSRTGTDTRSELGARFDRVLAALYQRRAYAARAGSPGRTTG